jgi:ABC-type glycerol-3-phosphate transport system substrate-binding protein
MRVLKKMVGLIALTTLVSSSMLFASGQNESPSKASSEKPYSGKEIVVAMQSHNATRRLVELLPEFEKTTGIKVIIDQLPQSEMNKKVEAAFVAGSVEYDVITTLIVNVARNARAGWIEPMDDFIAKDPNANIDDFMKGFIDSQKYKDKIYGLPFYGETSILMYNKDLFAKAGITTPPTTMDELLEDAKILTKDGVYGIALKGQRDQASNGYIWPMFLHSYGGEYFAGDTPVFNSPEGVKATDLFNELMKYAPPGAVNMGWNEVQIAVSQGQAAMTIDASNFASVFEASENSKVVGKIGYAPVPAGPAGQDPAIACASLNINAKSKNKGAAWEFIKWATSSESQLKMSLDGSRSDVTRNSVFSSDDYRSLYNWDNGKFIDSTQAMMNIMRGDYRPVYYPEWVQIGNAIAIQVQSVFTGDKTSQKALDTAAADVTKIMKDAGYIK